MANGRKKKWFLSLIALLIASPVFFPAISLSAWNDVSDSFNLNKTRPLYNYNTKVTYFDGSLTNISAELHKAPIRLVIDSITSSQVTVNNADGLMEDGKPYFDFSALLGDEILDPGETSTARQFEFYNPSRARFNFTIKVFVEIEEVIVLDSLSISPDSFTLTSAGETRQLTVTGTYSDGNTEDLTAASTGTTYTSSNPDVALVSPDGLVTAGTANGTAIITATNTGISASASVEVYIDVTLPVVTITSPADGVTLTSPQVTVLGTIEDESPIQSAFINGAPLTLDGIHFTAQVDLVDGLNPITVTATDAYANVGSDSISVTYLFEEQDTTAPLVSITAPLDGARLNQTPVTVTGTVQDASSIQSLTVNGQTATLTDTLFSLDLELTEGANTIRCC